MSLGRLQLKLNVRSHRMALLAKLACGTALAAVLVGTANAQQAGPNAAVEERETVVVIGQTIVETLPQELEKYGSDVEVLTSEELREGAFVDVSSAMQMKTPGLFIAPRGGPFSYMDISLQGSRSQDILFLVDGVRINNRLYPGTITDTLPASMTERVEVLKGGQGLFFGTQAAAGVINVVTRGYTDGFDGLFSIGLDTNEGQHFDGYIRGAAGPGNYVLYASQDKAEGFDAHTASEPSATDKKRGYDVDTIGAKYRWEVADNLTIDARYQHTDAALDYVNPSRTAFSQNVRDEDVASLGLDYAPSDMMQFLVKGYWHDWDTDYTTINNNPVTGNQDIGSLNAYWGYEDKGVNALAKITPGGPFEYLAGYDFQQYSARDDVWQIEPTEEDVHAVFGQIRTSDELLENGAFAVGVRHNETGGSNATVWNVSGRYDFTPNFYAEGLIGTSFLLPNAEQLYVIEEFWYLGNPDIEPEESENLNFSLGGSFGTDALFEWQATYFARKIVNLIGGATFADAGIDTTMPFRGLDISGSDPNGPFYDGVFVNVDGEVEVRGFELYAAMQIDDNWYGYASYTNSETQQVSGTSSVDIQRIPQDYAKIGAAYDASSGRWGVNMSALYTGEQRASVSGFGSVNYGDYVVVDLAGHVYLDDDRTHKLTLRVENLFDEVYITRPGSTETDASRIARAADPSLSPENFFYGSTGAPQAVHLRYSKSF